MSTTPAATVMSFVRSFDNSTTNITPDTNPPTQQTGVRLHLFTPVVLIMLLVTALFIVQAINAVWKAMNNRDKKNMLYKQPVHKKDYFSPNVETFFQQKEITKKAAKAASKDSAKASTKATK